jgi:hypothetical protein
LNIDFVYCNIAVSVREKPEAAPQEEEEDELPF